MLSCEGIAGWLQNGRPGKTVGAGSSPRAGVVPSHTAGRAEVEDGPWGGPCHVLGPCGWGRGFCGPSSDAGNGCRALCVAEEQRRGGGK